MHPLLKRILKNGLFTAGVLALFGYGYAELAGMWLASQAPLRTTPEGVITAAPQEPLTDSLHYRIPAMMALWGFVFVSLGEVVLHRVRSRRATLAARTPQPDPAELLMKQMMLDAQGASSPSSPPAQNSPVSN